MKIINDILITVGTDNKLIKFDLVKNQVLQTYKSKFLISSIRLLLPQEDTESDMIEIPNRCSKEDQIRIIVSSVNGYVELIDFDLTDLHT